MIIRNSAWSISIDLSAVDGKSMNVISDAAKTIQFSATHFYCGPSIEYQFTYSPTSTTSSLFTLPTITDPKISFAKALSTLDAKAYTLTVSARPAGTTTSWMSTTTATFTYIDECATTTIDPLTITDMTTSVLKQTTPGGSSYYE